MTKRHRLGGLQMGKTRHDGVSFALGQVQQTFLQARQLFGNSVDFIAQIQANIGGHLIIARASGVQLFTRDADAASQFRLDVHVHVFKAHRPGKVARDYLGANGFKAINNLLAFCVGQHADFRQHGGVRDGAVNVVMVEAIIKTNRGGKTLDKGIGRFRKAATPRFDGLIVLAHKGKYPLK